MTTRWKKGRAPRTKVESPNPKISVVVPSLGDHLNIQRNVMPLASINGVEVCVVESDPGGARLPGVVWTASAKKNRAYQMNRGARQAKGPLLLFLHADTKIPPESLMPLYHRLKACPQFVGGAFRFALDSPSTKARIIERGVRLRELLWKLPYGDQAIFVWKKDFDAVGGYPEVPILEDLLLIQALKRRGRLFFFPEKAVTSARRWEAAGYLKMTWINWGTLLKWRWGVPLERLAHARLSQS